MNFYEMYKKLSPEVAKIYKDIYITMIADMNSMSLHDMMTNLDIFPYQAESMEQLHKEFTAMVLHRFLYDSRFHELPIKRAYALDEDDSQEFVYVIASKRCPKCGTVNYLAIMDDGKQFQFGVIEEMPTPYRTIPAPSCVYDVIGKYIGDEEHES